MASSQQPQESAHPRDQASLVPWSPPLGDSRMMFKELISAKGKKYRLGCEIPEDVDKDAWIAANSHVFVLPVAAPTGDDARPQETGGGNGYYYANANVHWPYVKHGDFITPDQTVINDLHITEYKLDWNTGGWNDYILYIKSNKYATYTFYDEEGDYYNLDVTFTAWRHTFTYKSHKPNIVRIHATSNSSF